MLRDPVSRLLSEFNHVTGSKSAKSWPRSDLLCMDPKQRNPETNWCLLGKFKMK